MKTSSCKQKGRTLQYEIRDALRLKFSELDAEEIESRGMGQHGTDIILTPTAKKLIPFDIESKNQENINIWQAIKQAETNSKDENRIPLVVFRRNRSKTYCVIEFEKLLAMLK